MSEVRVVDQKTGGAKGQKPERMGLIPWGSVLAISRTYAYGAQKYDDPEVGPYNWRRGYVWSLSFDALMRHLAAFWEGENLDKESGLPHLAHAGWHVLTLLWFAEFKPEHDDRPNELRWNPRKSSACPECSGRGCGDCAARAVYRADDLRAGEAWS